MTRIRTLALALVLALALPVVIAACGGDDDGGSSDADPQEVLDATFSGDHQVTSGILDLTATVSAEGDQGGSFELALDGPFQGDAEDPTAIPQLDLTASASGEGGGEDVDFEGGLVITEDNAFIEYQGEAYELGADTFKETKKELESQVPEGADAEGVSFTEAFEQGCKQAIEQEGGDPSGCEFDISQWLGDPQNEGTEDVEGVETTHISSDLNVQQALTDIGNLAAGIPGAETSGFDPKQLGDFSDAVTEASFDVYSGVDDDILRKLEATLAIDPSQLAVGGAVPIDSLDVIFGFTLSDVNEDQTIEAPSDAKPIEEFLSATGLDDLGGLGGGLGGGGGLGELGGGGGGGGGGQGGAGTDVDPDAAQKYLECISEAADDPDKINECASQL